MDKIPLKRVILASNDRSLRSFKEKYLPLAFRPPFSTKKGPKWTLFGGKSDSLKNPGSLKIPLHRRFSGPGIYFDSYIHFLRNSQKIRTYEASLRTSPSKTSKLTTFEANCPTKGNFAGSAPFPRSKTQKV